MEYVPGGSDEFSTAFSKNLIGAEDDLIVVKVIATIFKKLQDVRYCANNLICIVVLSPHTRMITITVFHMRKVRLRKTTQPKVPDLGFKPTILTFIFY